VAVLADPEHTPASEPVLLADRSVLPWIVAALIAVPAIGLRVVQLGHQSFWYDESFTWRLVHLGFGRMFEVLPKTELTPPLYYILVWSWAKLFGTSEAGLRSLSALAGMLTVPVIFVVARKLISARAGVFAAALAACNPLLIWYSREARSYALLVLLAALSLLAFSHLLAPRPSQRAILAWALAAGLTGATHYYGALVIVPEALWLLWVHRRDWRVWLAMIVAGAADLALLPLALSQRPNASWIAGWPLARRLAQIPPQLLLGTGAPDRDALKIIGAVALIVAIFLLARRSDGRERRGALIGGALAVSTILISLALVVAGVDELITRNIIVALLELILVLAAALGARRAGIPGIAGLLAVCVVGIVCAVAVMTNPAFQRPDWRGLAHAIIAADRPAPQRAGGRGAAHGVGVNAGRSRVVIIERYFAAPPLNVYLPGLRAMKRTDTLRTREVDLVSARAPLPSWFCWWGAECNIKRSQIYRGIRIPGFRDDHRLLHAGQFTVLRLIARRPLGVTWGELFGAMVPTHEDGWAMLVQPRR